MSITLIPNELTAQLGLDAADLDALALRHPAGAYMAAASRSRLALFESFVELAYVSPFDARVT